MPLLVEELVRGHVRVGTVHVVAGGATWRGGANEVPGSIRDLVEARLAMLDAVERDIVVAGAVVGDFDPVAMRARRPVPATTGSQPRSRPACGRGCSR